MAKTDQLADEAALQAIAGIPDAWLEADTEIRQLVQRAIDEGWLETTIGQQKFIDSFLASTTYQNNGAYMAAYLVAQDKGGEDWITQQENARQLVLKTAGELGANLDDTAVQKLADSAMMYGWTEASRQYLLKQALTGQLSWEGADGQQFTFDTNYLDYGRGLAATNVLTLKQLAAKNGVDYTDNWFEQAATSIVSGLRSVDDFKTEIRQQAASLYPVYAEKIMAGFDVSDLASPYVSRMAKVLEMDQNQISLDNQYIKQALLSQDDKGNPITMNLWDFEKMLRATPEWAGTKAASDKAGEITSTILRMFTGVS
jgi:hypothetical protein